MSNYDLVAVNPESTVLAEYEPEKRKEKEYQSEAQLEAAFIKLLQQQAYEYLPIKSETDLIVNLRKQIELVNDYEFSDSEWKKFFNEYLANKNEGIEQKTFTIQEDNVKNLKRDNGETKNITLIDKDNIHNNRLQVINQYAVNEGTYSNRYDVTVLVNGLPLVHIELKRRGVDIKEAFNQIDRYQRESFWAGCGLFEFVQIFIISNGTYTKYYSNTTRDRHIKELNGKTSSHTKKTSDSFEFTSWWADANNRPISDLMDFGRTFFAKHAILNLITKYCIYTTEKVLMVMRPYQIVAVERIMSRINTASNYKKYGTLEGGGYIWHTTGSGKTLTSFKAARLASKLPYIDKVLFVVDRKDLDYQTMKEYDKFEKGAANSNTNTAILKRQLENPDSKIIITTIQKLSVFIKKNKSNPVFQKHIVIIFDECHRSQFGDMHSAIIKNFKKFHLFGFTGTPIFAENAGASGLITLKTTEQAFGDKLHTYTIVDAIRDKNVLPFRVEYYSTLKEEENIRDEKIYNIDREKALMSPDRISRIVKYILEHFDQKTMRNKSYQLKDKRLKGFNSILATASISACKLYYTEFRKQMENLSGDKKLKIATIFSYCQNEEEPDGIIDDENPEETTHLDQSSREFLEGAIDDYNKTFKTNFDTSSDKFQNYYKDVSEKVKNREIDLLIVVNMFLTGFDATTLNTLWVDKNLRLHGLLQAYSRTNRILNSIKTFGNIICFRNLEKATDESIALFGDKDAKGIVLMRSYSDYYNGYKDENGKNVKGYKQLIEELQSKYPLGQTIDCVKNQKDFIRLFNSILRVTNVLSSFDEFEQQKIICDRDAQDYRSVYINIHDSIVKPEKSSKTDINDDLVFEMELIKQVDITIDYILELVRKYHNSHCKDKETAITINSAINSSLELRSKKDLIDKFIASLTPSSNVDKEWHTFVIEEKKKEIEKIIKEEGLNKDETNKFIQDSFRDGYITETGTAITKLLPPMDPFAGDGAYNKKKRSVLERLKRFFERYFGI